MNNSVFTIYRETKGCFSIVHVDIVVPELPDSFSGYRMVQLSDLHFGSVTPDMQIKNTVSLTQELAPDLILLTGDYLQMNPLGRRYPFSLSYGKKFRQRLRYRRHARTLLKALGEILSDLRPRDGIVGIFGNHDCVVGKRRVAGFLGNNIVWLTNQSVLVKRGDSTFQISGVDDVSRGKPNIMKALTSAETRVIPDNHEQRSENSLMLQPRPFFKTLLCHNPDITITRQAKFLADADLLLCGHTHGGQCRIPPIGAVVTRTHQRKFIRGMKWHKNTAVYVSSGIGFSLLPLRFLCPAEITVFRFLPG